MTSISQQQQPSSQASNSLNATPADSVRTPSPSISGTSSPLAAAPAPATARSYANATKKPFSSPIASSTTGSTPAVGGQASAQHGKSNSISPVNGKTSIPPAVPAVATPTIVNSGNAVNGVSAQGGHSRKSSVTISAAGTSGFIPNGGPVAGPPSRTNSIQFGSMNAGGSPVATNSTPHTSQASTSLPVASPSNPRVTSPATSPSPIPQPAASGGRPPSGLQGQGNGLSFGSLGGEPGESNRQMRPVSMPQGPLAPGPQQGHLRRESSQSTHSDMGNPGMGPGPGRGGYPPQGGRGRGYPQPYPQQMGYSPGAQFRGAPNQRGGPNVAPQFPGQAGPMGQYPGSPHRSARSPALANSHPATPQMQQVPMANPQMHPSQYGGYAPHMGPPQGQYGMPPHFDPAYTQYQQQYGMYPGMQYMPPSSPRPSYHMPQGAQQQYIQGQYAGHPQPQPMSRTSSAVSERPNSSVGQPQTPSIPPATSHSHQPSHGSSSPVPSSDFKIPTRGKSAGIVIKDPTSGAVKTFEKQPASPAPVSRSPAIVSSTPTPPPRPSSNDPHHARSESRSVKTDEEKKNDMRDAIAKKIEADKAEERRLKDEEQRKAAKEKEEAELALKEAEKSKEDAEKAEKAAAEKAQQEKEAAEQAKKDADDKAEKEHAEKARKEEEERAQKEKEKDEKAEKAKKEAEARAKADAEMKNAEREAEEAEEARLKTRAEQEESEESEAEKASLFASLKNRRAPPASAATPPAAAKAPAETGTSTPASDDSMAPPAKPSAAKRDKPAALKLETKKPVEPAQPSAALQSLRSARPIDRLNDITYPSSIASPNPALNSAASDRKFKYQRDFLLQFQQVFTEKPSENWEDRVKETVGDTSDSSRPQSARTPSMGGRTPSGRPGVSGTFPMGMGNFVGQGRTLPPQTTSADRYAMSIGQQPRPAVMNNPLASLAGRPGGFPLPGQGSMSRSGSSTQLQQSASRNQREVSRRGQRSKNGSERIDSHKGSHADAAKMPLTAGAEIKSLQVSSTGWKPRSIVATSATGAAGPAPGDSGHMAPDMVQRKVKSNLNKMTPEKFDKIADQILEIAAQSKDETDGRTLRQVIQLTFEKATDEAHWASMYAKFCKRMLETMNPDIKDENIKDKNGNVVTGGNLFRKYLLNRCQEEFERGWKVNLPPKPEGESEEAVMLSDEYYIAAAAKRRGLGLVQFIGELYKLGMLTERIMHECVKKLVDFEGTPDEAEVESLTKLLKTIGRSLDSTERGPALMEVYFQRINAMVELPDLHSRLKFMLMDIIDLRRKGWKSKDSEKGPKTIQEIREEALAAQQEKELERARQSQRGGGGGGRMHLGRGDARSFSGGGYGMQPPPDYQKNTVGMDDLRRLGSKAGSRQLSQGPASFGPTSMFNSRSSSGRKTLGPGGSLRAGDDSGASSRTGTPPAQKEKEKESTTHVNAFSALAALDGDHADVASPPSSPPTTKTKPAASSSAAAPASEAQPASSSDAAAKGDEAKTT